MSSTQTIEEVLQAHDAWLMAHYAAHPPIRLADPVGYEGEPTYVDQVFAGAAHIRGIWAPVVKRGPGRPRKDAKPQ